MLTGTHLDVLHADGTDDADDAAGPGGGQQGLPGGVLLCPRTRVEVLLRVCVCVGLQQLDPAPLITLVHRHLPVGSEVKYLEGSILGHPKLF